MPTHLIIILLIVLFILFLLSSIFSGSETAYSIISAAKINALVEEKARNATLIQKQKNKFNQILGTILIGNNIVNVGSSVLTSLLLSQIFGNDNVWPTVISIAIVTPVLLIFGEIGPKLIAKHHCVRYLQIFSPFIEIMYWILWVLTLPISKIGKEVLITHTEDDLKTMINLAQNEGVLQTGESILVKNALDLDSTKVQQHYIRLKDVSYLDYKDNIATAKEMFKKTNYSRLPIMKNDQLIGMVMLKDIFHLKKGKIITYMQTLPYISANSLLSSALDKLRKDRAQMGLVVENNNSTKVKGIITIEDILEEIVGEIYDEHDNDEEIYELSLEKSQVQSGLFVYDVFKQLDIQVSLLEPDEEELTLEQYLLKKSGDKKLYKKTSFTLEDKYQFKVISIAKDKKSYSIIEINKL
ncbi:MULTISPECIES: CNNM domain-containing protein [unclassified Mycoplasma]|uniref:CNNM domain-containing protein n=1 Tax=unclassified Mycoplasma TaxID=2683645 RepID=UPI00211BC2B9|nr:MULTISPECIES: CNNM domain-containing protein [unclassified Mycoplasma]UUM19708.1 CNNM domain-containing protein [Mycoplasma sp. 1578d]UUM24691.1 CNNM domain-containing protein [Mycoplasma sp. 3686d]